MVVLVVVERGLNESLLIAQCKGLMCVICALGIKVSSLTIRECVVHGKAELGARVLLLLLLL